MILGKTSQGQEFRKKRIQIFMNLLLLLPIFSKNHFYKNPNFSDIALHIMTLTGSLDLKCWNAFRKISFEFWAGDRLVLPRQFVAQ